MLQAFDEIRWHLIKITARIAFSSLIDLRTSVSQIWTVDLSSTVSKTSSLHCGVTSLPGTLTDVRVRVRVRVRCTHWRKVTMEMLVFSSSSVTGTHGLIDNNTNITTIYFALIYIYEKKHRDYLIQLIASHLRLRYLAQGFSIHVYNSYIYCVAMSRRVTPWAVSKFVVVWDSHLRIIRPNVRDCFPTLTNSDDGTYIVCRNTHMKTFHPSIAGGFSYNTANQSTGNQRDTSGIYEP